MKLSLIALWSLLLVPVLLVDGQEVHDDNDASDLRNLNEQMELDEEATVSHLDGSMYVHEQLSYSAHNYVLPFVRPRCHFFSGKKNVSCSAKNR